MAETTAQTHSTAPFGSSLAKSLTPEVLEVDPHHQPTVLMHFPQPVLLTISHQKQYRFARGVNQVPVELKDHPQLRSKGVRMSNERDLPPTSENFAEAKAELLKREAAFDQLAEKHNALVIEHGEVSAKLTALEASHATLENDYKVLQDKYQELLTAPTAAAPEPSRPVAPSSPKRR